MLRKRAAEGEGAPLSRGLASGCLEEALDLCLVEAVAGRVTPLLKMLAAHAQSHSYSVS